MKTHLLVADWRRVLLLMVAFAALAAIHIYVYQLIGNQPVVGDGVWYAELSRNNPLNLHFWTDVRPGFYPFLMKILGPHLHAFQWIFYFLACCLAVSVILLSCESLIPAIIGSVLLVLVTSSHNYIFWSTFAFTESYTLSCCLILVSLSLLAGRSKWVWPPILVVLCTMVLVRDVNLYLAISFLGLIGLSRSRALLAPGSQAERLRAWTRHYAAPTAYSVTMAASILLLLFALGATWYAQRAKYRYLTNLVNVIQMRMLPNAEASAYLAQHDLVIGPVLASRAYKAAWESQEDNASADMQAFGVWLREKGLRTYEQFLLSHPKFLLSSLIEDRPKRVQGTMLLDDMGLPSLMNLHSWQGFYPAGSGFVARLHPSWMMWASSVPMTWPGYLLMLGVACWMVIRGWSSGRGATIACLAISTLPGLAVSILADAWDVWRHGLPFIFLAQLCTIVFMARMFGVVVIKSTHAKVPSPAYLGG